MKNLLNWNLEQKESKQEESADFKEKQKKKLSWRVLAVNEDDKGGEEKVEESSTKKKGKRISFSEEVIIIPRTSNNFEVID